MMKKGKSKGMSVKDKVPTKGNDSDGSGKAGGMVTLSPKSKPSQTIKSHYAK